MARDYMSVVQDQLCATSPDVHRRYRQGRFWFMLSSAFPSYSPQSLGTIKLSATFDRSAGILLIFPFQHFGILLHVLLRCLPDLLDVAALHNATMCSVTVLAIKGFLAVLCDVPISIHAAISMSFWRRLHYDYVFVEVRPRHEQQNQSSPYVLEPLRCLRSLPCGDHHNFRVRFDFDRVIVVQHDRSPSRCCNLCCEGMYLHTHNMGGIEKALKWSSRKHRSYLLLVSIWQSNSDNFAYPIVSSSSFDIISSWTWT